MIQAYKKMLSFISIVTRNELTDAINSVLDKLNKVTDLALLSEVIQ